jgi:arginyl-tRNA synthetase
MQELTGSLKKTCQKLFGVNIEPELTRPELQFGDYSTNVAMRLAGKLNKNPRDIAEAIKESFHHESVGKVEIAGPGFINFTLSDDALTRAISHDSNIPKSLAGKVVVAEYSDPNPFKVLHVGHLYTSVVGDAIANLLSAAGAKTHRVNFGGDVGLHVGKTMWAILQKLGGEHPEKLVQIPERERSEWMTECYVAGNNAFDDDESAKTEIIELNKRVYQLHEQKDHNSSFAKIYWTCRQWSYDYFNEFYEKIGSKFEKYYPESDVADLGIKTVKEQLAKGVYEQSDGAVVFKGEPYGLHTRVFINSNGIPTYEAKDVGLIMTKWRDYHFGKSVVITGNDIVEYMKVVLKSIEQFEPELVERTVHLTHGNVKLQGGVKMSSRKGNILRAAEVIEMTHEASAQNGRPNDDQIVLGAIKYAFLKQRIGADIIFDAEESVSLEGNSGPYLQYAHARACSILNKPKAQSPKPKALDFKPSAFDSSERLLARKISEYPEVIEKATAELMPHHICTYLYELAQTFNGFYEKCRVVGDPREAVRLKLVDSYAITLKNGLELLNIAAPEQL